MKSIVLYIDDELTRAIRNIPFPIWRGCHILFSAIKETAQWHRLLRINLTTSRTSTKTW